MKNKTSRYLGVIRFYISGTFQDSEGNRSYGGWGLPVIENGEMIGLQASDPEYSWGHQMDGSYIEPCVHQKENHS